MRSVLYVDSDINCWIEATTSKFLMFVDTFSRVLAIIREWNTIEELIERLQVIDKTYILLN